MSITNIEEITCQCGHIFEAELLSAISVSDNPELKEALMSGEINIVSCPQCGAMFYAESFILYHDSKNELIAFVYPLSFQSQAAQCRKRMLNDFKIALENFNEKDAIKYEPLMIFGIEDLALLLKNEQEVEDEETVLTYLAPYISLETIKISASMARKLNIPKVFPVLKGQKNLEAKSVIAALEILIKHNPNLTNYKKLFKTLSQNANVLNNISKKGK